MSVLNRPMFNRTSTVVNRKDGSPERGEVSMNPEPFLTNLFQLFKRLNPNYDAETDEFRQEKFQEERDQAKFKALSELYKQIKESDPESVLREGEFATNSNTNADPELVDLYNAFLADNIDEMEMMEGLEKVKDKDKDSVTREGELPFDPNAVTREGEKQQETRASELSDIFNQIKKINEDAVLREGEFATELNAPGVSSALLKQYNDLISNKKSDVTREGEFPFDPNAVTREGERSIFGIKLPFAEGGEVNGLKDIEMRFRQEGSPQQGEKVNAENIGIMDGFGEEEQSQIVKKGEEGKQKIDSAQDYSELMNSTRGDSATEEQRRDELAQYVGEKDAEQTPDSVLALIQPLMQMLDTEAGSTGIAMSSLAQMNMPQATPQAQGGIPGFKDGGIVKRQSGSSILGEMSGTENQYLMASGDPRLQEMEDTKLAEQLGVFYDLFSDTSSDDSTTDSALKKKYEENYRIFKEILGGQSPGKEQMQGEMLTQVVAPLAFAYARGAPLTEILATGSQKVGQIATAYDKLNRKDEAAIRNAALTQALKKVEDPLLQVYLRDNPDTPEDESLQKVFRKTSDVLAAPDLYTAESVAVTTANVEKIKSETEGIKRDNAIKDIELKYKDIFEQLDINAKEELIQATIKENQLRDINIELTPEKLAAEIKAIDLSNTEKSINNEFARPKKILELESLSVDIDVKLQDLKRKEIENKYADRLANLTGDKLEQEINLLSQDYDFNQNNNILLLEKTKAEIDNLKLTGEKLELENEYQGFQNIIKEEGINEEIQAKILENQSKQLDIINQQIEIEYLPTEKDLGIEKLKTDIEKTIMDTKGQRIINDKGVIELNFLNDKLTNEATKQLLEIEQLEFKLNNPEKDWQKVNAVVDYKNKWYDSDIYKNTVERQDKMFELVNSATADTGAGDISFVYQFMKMLDPNSVVREGEFATAETAGGVPEFIWKTYNNLNKGEGRRLSGPTKTQFLDIAAKMYINQLKNYDAEWKIQSDIAGRLFGEDEIQNAIPYMNINVDLITQLTNKDTFNRFFKKSGYMNLSDVGTDEVLFGSEEIKTGFEQILENIKAQGEGE